MESGWVHGWVVRDYVQSWLKGEDQVRARYYASENM
jgi:hypothetical protein